MIGLSKALIEDLARSLLTDKGLIDEKAQSIMSVVAELIEANNKQLLSDLKRIS